MKRKTRIGLIVGTGNFVITCALMVIVDFLVVAIPALQAVQTPCSAGLFVLSLPVMLLVLPFLGGANLGLAPRFLFYVSGLFINAVLWGAIAALIVKGNKKIKANQ